MENEIESSFSIKELIIYFLNKWVIMLLVAVIGAAAYFGVSLVLRQGVQDSYQATASFCSLEEFIRIRSEYVGNPSVESIYNNIANRTIAELNTNELKDSFLKNEEALIAFRKVYETKETVTDFSYELNRYFTFAQSGVFLKVSVSGSFLTEEQKNAAKDLVNIYIEMAANNTVPGYVTITKALPDYTGQSVVLQRGYTQDILISIVVGIIAGFVVVILIYFFDPGIKCYGNISQLSGEIISISKNLSVDPKAARYASVKMINDKTLFVCSFFNSSYGANTAHTISQELSKSGLKILYIDFTDTGKEAVNIGDYLNGKNLSPEKHPDYQYFGSKSDSDWFLLMNKDERFSDLISNYDKVVIHCSDNKDGSAVVVEKFADKMLFVISKSKDKLKHVNQVLKDVYFGGNKVIGSFIC